MRKIDFENLNSESQQAIELALCTLLVHFIIQSLSFITNWSASPLFSLEKLNCKTFNPMPVPP